jgi:hypothetical protein
LWADSRPAQITCEFRNHVRKLGVRIHIFSISDIVNSIYLPAPSFWIWLLNLEEICAGLLKAYKSVLYFNLSTSFFNCGWCLESKLVLVMFKNPCEGTDDTLRRVNFGNSVSFIRLRRYSKIKIHLEYRHVRVSVPPSLELDGGFYETCLYYMS